MLLIFWIVLFFVVIVVSNLITRKQTLTNEDKKRYTYTKKSRIMSEHEFNFYKILNDAVGNDYYILAQAHLSAFLDHKVYNGQRWNAAFRHINSKSIDYLLCNKQTLQPLLAIELDDKSHEKQDRRLRDEEVERIFSEANIALLRMPSHGTITTLELQSLIEAKIGLSTNEIA